MSGKKKRMRETAVEDVGGSQECEGSTRNCDNLLDLLHMIQNEQKAAGAATEARKANKVLDSGKVAPSVDPANKLLDSGKVSPSVNAADVQCAESSPQKKKRKKNKSKKKATVESGDTSSATNSDSLKQVQKNPVITISSDSADQANGYHVKTRSKAESTNPALQPKKKRKKRKSKIGNGKANLELNTSGSNNISNGQVVEKDVTVVSDHSADDPLLTTSEMIDLTTEDSTLEDPSSFEPYSNAEVSMAQDIMKWEVNQGPLKWFLQRLKVRNTAAHFVPRTSHMENEYAGLEDDFPMPTSS